MYDINGFSQNQFDPTSINEIFYDKFLKEKESALYPIFLDDSIPIKNNESNNVIYEKLNSKKFNEKMNRLRII